MIPTRMQGESGQDFIDRCMVDPVMINEFPEESQRRAVCQTTLTSNSYQQQDHCSSCLIANYAVRQETFENRAHLVAPVVILTEGVHAGSRGPIFYPRAQLQTFPVSWNGIPVPINHPDENGMPIIANRPDVIDQHSVGRLFNVVYEEVSGQARLRGEVWVDIEKAAAISPDTLQRLQDNQPLEVSTGLLSENENTPGTFGGESYQYIARNFRPDHLALLPNAVGACSIADGCGIRNQRQEDNKMGRTAVPVTNETKQPDQFMSEALLTNAGIVELRNKLQSALDALDIWDGPNRAVHYLREAFPSGDSTGQAIVRIEGRNGTSTMASDYVVSATGSVSFGVMTPVEVVTTFTPVTNETNNSSQGCGCDCSKSTAIAPENLLQTNNAEGEDQMAKNTPERAEKVTSVITANVGFGEDERTALDGMDCDMFAIVEGLVAKNNELTANAVTLPTEVDAIIALLPEDVQLQVNEGRKKIEDERTALVTAITANEANPFSEEDLTAMPVAQLQGLASMSAVPVVAGLGQAPTMNYAANAGAVPVVNTEEPGMPAVKEMEY